MSTSRRQILSPYGVGCATTAPALEEKSYLDASKEAAESQQFGSRKTKCYATRSKRAPAGEVPILARTLLPVSHLYEEEKVCLGH